MNYARIAEIAARFSSHAVIGAYALAARGYIRQTADFDLLTTDRSALTTDVWDREREDDMRVDVHRGDFDDPLAGVARIRGNDLRLDVVVAKYTWQAAVIDRAEPKNFGDVMLRVPLVSDLIVMKVDAGGYLDLRDAVELLEIGMRQEVLVEIGRLLPTLPSDLQTRVTAFLQNISANGW